MHPENNNEQIAIEGVSPISRRQFFRILGSGIAVTWLATETLASDIPSAQSIDEHELASWLHIGTEGKVTVYTGKSEVGQNIRTSLAQIVAEELNLPFGRIEMIMADTSRTPYDRGTFGSRSIPFMGPPLRKAAATARDILVDLASKKWKAEPSDLFLQDGDVKCRSVPRAVSIGELMEGKEFVAKVNEQVVVKQVNDWTIAGTSIPKANGELFVTGRHKYVSDMKLPGMLYGKVLRPPSYGSVLQSVDTSRAITLPGVIVVHDGDFVGVVAPSIRLASQALLLIDAQWKSNIQPDRKRIFDYLKENTDGAPRDYGNTGDVNSTFPNAAAKIEPVFHIDYIAHVPLEPRAGLAVWDDDHLTVYTGTQVPFGVQEDLSDLFHISKDNVRVVSPDTGSGYGGKHTGEAGIEAARLARAAKSPVKVLWTREEEFAWAYFRPAGVIEVKASADVSGRITSWEFHNYNSGPSGITMPYEVANKKIQYHSCKSPLRQGSYRGLAATANAFARESAIDDLSARLGMEPYLFRLQNLTDQRMIGVLKAAASEFGWGTSKPAANHGFGIACATEKGSYVATCAEVAVDATGRIKVIRAVVSFECGAIINPEHLSNQIQGSLIQGLGGALFERIEFANGVVLNGRMSKYRVPRFKDVPIVKVVMVNRRDLASAGAGETPILGIAPAIRNAIAQATGARKYTMPLVPDAS